MATRNIHIKKESKRRDRRKEAGWVMQLSKCTVPEEAMRDEL